MISIMAEMYDVGQYNGVGNHDGGQASTGNFETPLRLGTALSLKQFFVCKTASKLAMPMNFIVFSPLDTPSPPPLCGTHSGSAQYGRHHSRNKGKAAVEPG